MSESYESLRRLFSDAGYAFVEPPLLYDAGVFIELAGEDLRRRLYLTSAPDGRELALRPDFTIPVCLQHLAGGPAQRRADYAYLGPIFRQRRDEPGELFQAGVESLGRRDREAADADLLALALAAVGVLGVAAPPARIGDSALFAATLDALGLVEPWRRRLARAFGDPERLGTLVKRLANGDSRHANGAKASDRRSVRRTASDVLARTGLATVGGRSADEIATRFVEKAALATGNRRASAILAKFLKIAGEPSKAIAALRRLAVAEGLDIGHAIDRFERRASGFAARGIDLKQLFFAADFGRRLDYYTGFVFEIYDRPEAAEIAGGGRYDRLLAMIGAGEAVPAIGFSIWLDRIAKAGP